MYNKHILFALKEEVGEGFVFSIVIVQHFSLFQFIFTQMHVVHPVETCMAVALGEPSKHYDPLGDISLSCLPSCFGFSSLTHRWAILAFGWNWRHCDKTVMHCELIVGESTAKSGAGRNWVQDACICVLTCTSFEKWWQSQIYDASKVTRSLEANRNMDLVLLMTLQKTWSWIVWVDFKPVACELVLCW